MISGKEKGEQIVMYDKMTRKDIQRMEEEIEYRRLVVRKQALEAVKEARSEERRVGKECL